MRRFMVLFLCLCTTLPAFAEWDEFVDSNYFEPTIFCLVGGATGYYGGPASNQTAYAVGGCAIGALVTYAINKHYESKYTKSYNQKIDRLTESLKQFQELQANKAANGDEGPYSLRVREIVPAQVLSNGQVRAPTVSEKLIVPSADVRVGD